MANFIGSHVFGSRAHNKRLGPAIMGATLTGVESFIASAEAGDGYNSQQYGLQNINTTSRIMCLQYQQLYWRLRVPAISQYSNKPKEAFGYSARQCYRVQHQGNDGHCIRFGKIGGRLFALTRIRSITPAEPQDIVWNLEVESMHKVFATESGIAKNCSYCWWQRHCWVNNNLPGQEITLDQE
jgi:hypothetical protein